MIKIDENADQTKQEICYLKDKLDEGSSIREETVFSYMEFQKQIMKTPTKKLKHSAITN